MKKSMMLASYLLVFFTAQSQTLISDFESFTLTPNSAYSPTNSIPFQTSNAIFKYSWNTDWSFWDGGFSYTNVKDSTTTGLSNQYGVKAYSGYTNSSVYVVGLDKSTIKLSIPQTTVNGFYITNTTYAYKSMLLGDAFAKKFGDTTGTGSGTTIPQGSYPDFFKVVVKGYLNGAVKNDSVIFLLADFTFTNNTQDYILDSWQFVNTSNIGAVDSIQFFLRSSDVGFFGVNTPLYYAIDNFETLSPSTTNLAELKGYLPIKMYPNPFVSNLHIENDEAIQFKIMNMQGLIVYAQEQPSSNFDIDLSDLPNGIYYVEYISDNHYKKIKLIKH